MNSTTEPISLTEIIKLRRELVFVGRQEQLDFFRQNLSRDQKNRFFIFNIWGQAGVGKTYLIQQRYRQIIEEVRPGAIVVDTDNNEKDVPSVMGRIAEQFEKEGYSFKKFNERYKVFRQKLGELEADLNAPKGFSAFVGRTLTKGTLQLLEQIPAAGLVTSLVDKEQLADQIGDWISYAANRIGNKDEVKLVLHPVEVLTPLFLEELNEVMQKHFVGLFFDAYEQTGEFLDQWLRDILENRYGSSLNSNLIIVIAGQLRLDKAKWSKYEGILYGYSLEPFSEEETIQYLNQKGIVNELVVKEIWRQSEGLPLLVATLAVENPDDPTKVNDTADTAVRRFLQWINPRRRNVVRIMAIPRRFNRDLLAELVKEEKAEELFSWLKNLPFIDLKGTEGWGYHDIVRRPILRSLLRESPKDWSKWQSRLANYYESCADKLELDENKRQREPSWQSYHLDAFYHKICQQETRSSRLAIAINGFLSALKIQRHFATHCIKVIEQAGKDADAPSLEKLSNSLAEGMQAYDENCYQDAIWMFTDLRRNHYIEDRWRAVALDWRGYLYRRLGEYDKAREDLDEAIDLAQEKEAEYFADRGLLYCQIGRYEEALVDFAEAIQLKSDDEWYIASRSNIYCQIERYEEALEDIEHAIELSPDDEWYIANRGVTYRHMGRYYRERYKDDKAIEYFEKALTDFNYAINLKPDDEWYVANRGLAYRHMRHYEEALRDFNQSLKIKPDEEWYLANRGEIYRLIACYKEALADFNRAVELKSDYSWAIAHRGETYRQMGSYEEALSDFDQAIRRRPYYEWAIAHRGETYRQMGESEKAEQDLSDAIKLAPQLEHLEYEWAIAHRGKNYLERGIWEHKYYEKALSDFNRAIEINHKDHSHFYHRGLIYKALDQLDKAKEDLANAIHLVSDNGQANELNWLNLCSLALYLIVDNKVDEARSIYEKIVHHGPAVWRKMAIDDLKFFLSIFHNHSQANSMLNFLKAVPV